jgi:hypothetical protein
MEFICSITNPKLNKLAAIKSLKAISRAYPDIAFFILV